MAFLIPVPLPRHRRATGAQCARERPRCAFDAAATVLFAAGGTLRGEAGPALAAQIRAAGSASTTLLAVDGAGLGDVGARALADALPALPRLEEAVLKRNDIGDEACAALVDAMPASLRVLDIAGNAAGERTGHAIARLIARSRTLTHVYLMRQEGGGVGDAGVAGWPEAVRANGEEGGAFWFANLDGNGVSEGRMREIVEACVKTKRCVFPYSKYPGYMPSGYGA